MGNPDLASRTTFSRSGVQSMGALPVARSVCGCTRLVGNGAICRSRSGLGFPKDDKRFAIDGVTNESTGFQGVDRVSASYLACWAVMGIASTLALSTPSSIALVQVAGPRARQAIAMLTIIGGLATTIFRPVTGALDVAVGWRNKLLIYAAIHL